LERSLNIPLFASVCPILAQPGKQRRFAGLDANCPPGAIRESAVQSRKPRSAASLADWNRGPPRIVNPLLSP
jgi:hypothetical protein